ncbi:hypothetical protein J2Z21_008763 [Streptomyces griseochromogenes]|uniref:Uncharacterized protein n=1 Tax=Streptomyces griseochromogenes TaxID=68214 RepID=A0A1B1B0R1_9ACTN|nr:hypothetical protein [Streptomyces griseochromogenes]ANP52331.1 hypothetical protein AVL59_24785 [Streptomyces griseochromogenes]MBP2055747.1 hypothetical protein [Streptomyces griseochromogenes]
MITQAYADPRPGEAIGIDLLYYERKRGEHLVAESPVFAAPIRMDDPAGNTDGLGVKAPIPASAKPGSYPLVVKAGGRVVARDTINVKPLKRPSIAMDDDSTRRPGVKVNLYFDDLYPGESGTTFTAHSTAFTSPVHLAHDKKSWNNTRTFNALDVQLRRTLHDGTYAVWVTDAAGKRKAEVRLKIRSARPGDDDYRGKAQGPAFFGNEGYLLSARAKGFTIAAGRTVYVRWQDAHPDPGEEEWMTATSPAFRAPARLKFDVVKGHEEDDPIFWGPARIKSDLKRGSYPVTIVSHHGRVKKTSYLTITQGPTRGDGETRLPIAVWAGASTGAIALVAAAAVLLARRRKRTSTS